MSYNKNTFANCIMTGCLLVDFSQSQTYGALFCNISKIPNKERRKRNKKRRRRKRMRRKSRGDSPEKTDVDDLLRKYQ